MIIDTHIHLSHPKYDQQFPYLSSCADGVCFCQDGTRDKLIRACRETGIVACLEPAIGIDSNERLLALAHKYPKFVYPAVGVHPTRTNFDVHRAANNAAGSPGDRKGPRLLPWRERKRIERYAQDPLVAAIGETGLDYHYPRRQQHRLWQMCWFLWQLRLAHKRKLPVVLHVREAHRDALRLLKLFRGRLPGGVCHCFSGDAKLARQYTALGFRIGIGGALLAQGPGQADLEEAVMQTPLGSILLETDGPYVRPDCPGLTKKQRENARNTSLILPAVAKRIAQLKQIPVEEVMEVTTLNAEQTFSIKPQPGPSAARP